MVDSRDSDKTTELGSGSSKPKVWTAIRHSFALIAFLGLFVAISAYASDPSSGVITVGWIMTGVGILGFVVGLLASRRD